MTAHWLALLLLIGMVVVWVAVDAAWRRRVPLPGSPEARGERRGCGGCQDGTCTNRCDDEPGDHLVAVGKETR